MKNQTVNPRGLLLYDGQREAGSAEIDGKTITWEAGYTVSLLQIGGSKARDLRKYVVMPEMAAQVQKALADVGWGSLVTLELDGKQVIGVTVELDWSEQVAL